MPARVCAFLEPYLIEMHDFLPHIRSLQVSGESTCDHKSFVMYSHMLPLTLRGNKLFLAREFLFSVITSFGTSNHAGQLKLAFLKWGAVCGKM